MGIRSRFIKPSTEKFLEEARKIPGFSLFDLLHGYVYTRWVYDYIGIGVGEHKLAKFFGPFLGWINALITRIKPEESKGQAIGFADTYHGKVVPLETVKELVMINQEIKVPDLEQVIPYHRARSLILNHPDHIAVLDCPCRVARKHPCLPLDVCLIVGEPFVSMVLEHHPSRSHRITQDEAVAIIKAEDERGHVHHVFFKDAMLERFYAICNCCSCCCGAMQAQRNGTPMLCSSGYVSRVDEDLCIGCGDCTDYCQFEALSLVDNLNTVDTDRCMGCGVCVSKCKQGALCLELDAGKSLPLDVDGLMAKSLNAS